MLTMYHPFHSEYFETDRPRQLRREIAKQRAAGSTISRRDFEKRKRSRQIAKKHRTHNRRYH